MPDLVEEYGCGYGFYLGSTDQTVGLLVTYNDLEVAAHRTIPEASELPHGQWSAELRLGQDLFSTWCRDVMGPDNPVITATWPIVAGTIVVHELPDVAQCGPAEATLLDFVAETEDGERIQLGTFEVTNPAWSCFAG